MKKVLNFSQHPIKAYVHIPGSKSMSNRALLLAALANGISTIHNLQISDDIHALITALSELGINIQLNEKPPLAIVTGTQGQFSSHGQTIHCQESGSLVRFMLTVCAAIPGIYHFDAAPSLRKRPMATLLKLLTSQGSSIMPTTFPLTLQNSQGLRGGDIVIDASQTGQIVSALLMMAPFTKNPLKLQVKNLVSRAYVDLTCAVMADFGVQVERPTAEWFIVPQPQHYQARDYTVEPDFSTASYFFAAAAVTAGEVTMQPISRKNIKQGDIVFLSLLEKMGCVVDENPSGLTVKGRFILSGIEVNMNTCPDLFMTLAAIAPFAQTPTLITGISHARHKESDRLKAMQQGLTSLGVKVDSGKDWFKIYPSTPRSGTIHSQNDHRIAMAFTVLSLRVPELIIEDASCVAKSCPEFFQLWQGIL